MTGPVPKERPADALLRYMGPGASAKLALSLAMSRGGTEADITSADLKKLSIWAEWIAFQSHMLQLVLAGSVLVDMRSPSLDDFNDLTFKSTLKTLGPSASEAYVQELSAAADMIVKAMQKANASASSDKTEA